MANSRTAQPPAATALPPQDRDSKLDSFEPGKEVEFYLEVRKLITGYGDVVSLSGSTGERNWCYTGLSGFPNCDTAPVILSGGNTNP